MKTDTYTKTILTVIAVCLVILVVQQSGIVPSATAKDIPAVASMAEFQRTNTDGSINVRIVGIENGIYNSLPVELKKLPSGNFPVEIKGVSTYSPLPVEVKNSRLQVEPYRTFDVNVKNSYISTKPY